MTAHRPNLTFGSSRRRRLWGHPIGANSSRQLHNHSFTPTQLAQLYNFPSGVDGHGQCVAIIELGGGYRLQDLTAYFAQLGVAMPRMKTVAVDGAHNHPTGDPSGPDGEVMLDIEVAGALAPAAQFVVYFAPNTDRGFLDAIKAAIHDHQNRPSVISISWGGPESSWTAQALQVYDQAFQEAAALGVTICCAAGDDGSSDGISDGYAHVDFPASSPYVLACGGTHLEAIECGDQSGSGVERWDDGWGHRWRYQRVLHHARVSEAGQRPAIGQPWGSSRDVVCPMWLATPTPRPAI